MSACDLFLAAPGGKDAVVRGGDVADPGPRSTGAELELM